MMKLGLSPAAAGLLRALIARTAVDRDRILLSDYRSDDWQSLTFVGERHEIELRIVGSNAGRIAERLLHDLAEVEFEIPGQIVADIGPRFPPSANSDGSLALHIEALTIFE
jgi:hypothetical protein